MIDIICRDTSGAVAPRYKQFITFNFARFKQVGIEHYLSKIHSASINSNAYGTDRVFDKLEGVHEAFMGR
jgi:hypothetical protein